MEEQHTNGQTPHREIVIVGGGMSGLTAAWTLRGRDVLVLEAEDRVGGRFRTETRDPYWLNLGAHVFKRNGPMATLSNEVGVRLIEPPGHFLATAMNGQVVRASRPELFLVQLPLAPAARISLARVGLKIQNGTRLLRTPNGAAALERKTFGEYLAPMHPNVEALMRVIANRIGGELDEVAADVGVNTFNQLWMGSRLNIYAGSAELPKALHHKLGNRVVTGARVRRVRPLADCVEIEYAREGQVRYVLADACAITVPAPQAGGLVPDLPPQLVAALSQMKYSPFLVAGIFTNETGAMPWDDLYAVAVPDRSFCMFFNPANALRTTPKRIPGGALVVYAVARRADLLQDLSDEEIRTRYLNDLYAIFPAARGIVREVIIQRWRTAVAVGFAGRAAVQAKLNTGHRGIFFGGDYMIPPSGIDASESGRAVAGVMERYLEHKTLKEPGHYEGK